MARGFCVLRDVLTIGQSLQNKDLFSGQAHTSRYMAGGNEAKHLFGSKTERRHKWADDGCPGTPAAGYGQKRDTIVHRIGYEEGN